MYIVLVYILRDTSQNSPSRGWGWEHASIGDTQSPTNLSFLQNLSHHRLLKPHQTD